jgi:hypothetical protein
MQSKPERFKVLQETVQSLFEIRMQEVLIREVN